MSRADWSLRVRTVIEATDWSVDSEKTATAVSSRERVRLSLRKVIGHSRPAANSPVPQALSARTAGRSAGVGRRRALAGSVTTATVFPIMSKNSTE